MRSPGTAARSSPRSLQRKTDTCSNKDQTQQVPQEQTPTVNGSQNGVINNEQTNNGHVNNKPQTNTQPETNITQPPQQNSGNTSEEKEENTEGIVDNSQSTPPINSQVEN